MKSIQLRASIAIVAGALFGATAAHAATKITFDAGDPIGGLAAGTVLDAQYSSIGVTFTPSPFTGPGGPNGDWATNTNMTIVASSGSSAGSLGTPSLVSGNILRSLDNWLNENGDPSFAIAFAQPIDFFSADFAGVQTPADVKIFAYSGSSLLGTSVGATVGQFTLSFASAAAIITKIVITPGDYNDWVGVDNLTFNPSPVPEVSTSLLFVAGLAGIGFMSMRRKRREP